MFVFSGSGVRFPKIEKKENTNEKSNCNMGNVEYSLSGA